MPKVELLVADSESPKQFTFQDALVKVSWETTLLDQPGKCTFEVIDDNNHIFYEGSNVVLKVDNLKVFDGYVFSRKRSDGDTMSITAFDRLRYLQNKDVKVFENATASEIFATLCKEQELPYRIVNASSYKLPSKVHDNKALYSMLVESIEDTLVGTGTYYMVRDNVGTIEFVDVASLTTNILIGEASLLTGFDFESSIDSDTYNYVKLVQENKDTNKRDVYIVKDSNNIYKWGRLQYFEKVNDDANEAQIKAKADQLLKLYNRKTKSLKVTCLGDTSVSAGCGVAISIPKLATEGFAAIQYLFTSNCKHEISKDTYTMSLTLEVV